MGRFTDPILIGLRKCVKGQKRRIWRAHGCIKLGLANATEAPGSVDGAIFLSSSSSSSLIVIERPEEKTDYEDEDDDEEG
jgi:hypothetical protein